MEVNQKMGVEMEIGRDREGGKESVVQPAVGRGRERELGGGGGVDDGGEDGIGVG